ncbi:MAG: hypothetical protein IAI48_04920 [Candidatus Eremiobacteraeota bacterium]|nr:hypothetical protein [Candidatus Eremiobacteraeota bacterium]
MSRQIVNTSGQGLASSDGVKFAIFALIAAIVVLLIFFGLDKSGMGDRSAGMTTSSMGAPAPAAT